MDIEEIVNVVNLKLKQGSSTAQIEKEMKLGKDTLRKRLNRANYKYDKTLNQYILINNIHTTKSVRTPENTQVLYEKIELTEDEIKILKMIVNSYKKTNVDYVLNGEIITRSVRTYKYVLDQFSAYCKKNNLSQKDSIAIALLDFISK